MQRISCLFLGVAVVVACGGDGSQPTEPEPPRPGIASVDVQPDSAHLTEHGATVDFDATVTDSSGNTVADATITWLSSDTTVATVDTAGVAAATGNGVAAIIAEADGQADLASTVVEMTTGDWTQITAGGVHSCGLVSGGNAYCWGSNSRGRLGDGTRTDRHEPVAVSGGYSFEQIDAGGAHTCGLTADGTAYCWGFNSRGQLGDGTTTDRSEPVSVTGGHSFVEINAGRDHTCGRTDGGTTYCWGSNEYGRLGDGTTTDRHEPVQVTGGHSFARVSAGGQHTCAVDDGDTAYCWGRNRSGQLGDGTETNRHEPTAVTGSHAFASVSAGEFHTCGLTQSGTGYCWGGFGSGRLGIGDVSSSVDQPMEVAGNHTFTEISAGGNHTCAVEEDSAGYCWGSNSRGQLGDGTAIGGSQSRPTEVVGGHAFEQMDTGRHHTRGHTCGITPTGVAYCWGYNSSGQLGNGSTDDVNEPVRVSDPTG